MTPEDRELERQAQEILRDFIKQLERMNQRQTILSDNVDSLAGDVQNVTKAHQDSAAASRALAKAQRAANKAAEQPEEDPVRTMSWSDVLKAKVHGSKVTAREVALILSYVVTLLGILAALLTGGANVPALDQVLDPAPETGDILNTGGTSEP